MISLPACPGATAATSSSIWRGPRTSRRCPRSGCWGAAPALGLANCRIRMETPGPPTSLRFETEQYRVVVGPRGGLVSLATKDGRAVLRAGSGSLAGVIDGEACVSEGAATVTETPAG